MNLVPYSADLRDLWDDIVHFSRNGTFLLHRDYMDYHRDRIEDASVLCFSDKGRVIGLFPAAAVRAEQRIVSHSGLTYGGLILPEKTTTTEVLEIYDALLPYYRKQGFTRLSVKPIPYIYHRIPSDDELYALFRNGAVLGFRAVSSCLRFDERPPISTLRKRKIKKAKSSQIQIFESNDFEDFWFLLSSILEDRHHVRPVHTLREIRELKARFLHRIKLYLAQSFDGKLLAGTLLYLSNKVAHAQYIATSEEGRKMGALDLLFIHLIEERPFATDCHEPPTYFDFGISTEQGGRWLNEGLIFQKEGFGARAIVYDQYTLSLV